MQKSNLQLNNLQDIVRQVKADHELIVDLMIQIDEMRAEISSLKENLNNVKEHENGHSQIK